MLSRVNGIFVKRQKDDNGNLQQGQVYRMVPDQFGYEEIGLITRWLDGRLNDDGEAPAVEFADAHIEHYKMGVLHNERKDDNGKLQPAIIAQFGRKVEYYLRGDLVDQDGKPIIKN